MSVKKDRLVKKPRDIYGCVGLDFTFGFVIEPKQSARFTKNGIKKSQKVRDFENKIGNDGAYQHSLKGSVMLEGPIHYSAVYTYKLPKSSKAWMHKALKEGKQLYKETNPDVADNLNKGIVDALSPLFMDNDGRIARITAVKLYGLTDSIKCSFVELPNPF